MKEKITRRSFLQKATKALVGAAGLATLAKSQDSEANVPKGKDVASTDELIKNANVTETSTPPRTEVMEQLMEGDVNNETIGEIIDTINYAIETVNEMKDYNEDANETENILKEIRTLIVNPDTDHRKILNVYNHIFSPDTTDAPDTLINKEDAQEVLNILRGN